MVEVPTLWDLPGPRALAADIVHDCRAGRSVVLVLPDGRYSTSDYDDFLHHIGLDLEASFVFSDASFAAGMSAALGYDEDFGGVRDALGSVIQWEKARGKCFISTSWDSDLTEVVSRWPSLLKVAGLAQGERPVLILAVRPSGFPDLTRVLAEIDTWGVTIRWLWEVTTRLDTELTIALSSAGRLGVLEMNLLCDLCAWDLSTAGSLASHWRGDLFALRGMISELPDFLPRAIADRRHPSSQPPPRYVDRWCRGDIDSWEGAIHERLEIDDGYFDEIRWKSQVRVMFPRLEHVRSEFEQSIFGDRGLRSGTSDSEDGQSAALELGDILRIVHADRLKLTRADYQTLRAARDARNSLAHLKPVAGEVLETLLGPLRLR